MRFVRKKGQHTPDRLASEETLKEWKEIIRTGNKQLIKESIYRESYETFDGKRSRVEDQLAKSYLYKCAYCERICKADIEHYRPKKCVDEALNHPGYYWLCYEWTNLLPSCITCNREGAKHNHFPILGPRVDAPTLLAGDSIPLEDFKAFNPPLIYERPFLLHPEVDHPEAYFKFILDLEGRGIRLKGTDVEGRGEKTIAICKLNRNELTLDRVENVISPFKVSVECLFVELLNQKISEDLFVENMILLLLTLKNYSGLENKTHTLLRKYIVASAENFEEIVLPHFIPSIRNVIQTAYMYSF